MEDFKTMWNKMLLMPGEDRLDKIDTYLYTLTQEDAHRFLLMLEDTNCKIDDEGNVIE